MRSAGTDTDSGNFIHIQNAGSRRHQAFECYWKHDRTDENSQLHFLFLSDWSCHISCSYDFKRHCLPANSLLITLHQCLFQNRKKRTYYKSGMPLENFHFTVPIFLSALLYAGGAYWRRIFLLSVILRWIMPWIFMDYLNHKKNIPFEIQAFTNVESLIAYGKMNHIELLLISQRLCAVRYRNWKLVKLLYFRKACTHRIWTVIQVCINIRPLQMLCGKWWRVTERESSSSGCFPVLKRPRKFMQYYSPLGRCLKTSFCTYIRTDSGKRKSCSLSESGGILRLWRNVGKRVRTEFKWSSLFCTAGKWKSDL